MDLKEQEETTKKVYEEIGKEKSYSLKNKLLLVQRFNEERTKLQENNYEVEYLNLKKEYDLEYEKCYSEISNIIMGKVQQQVSEYDTTKYNLSSTVNQQESGIPDYWLTVLSNASMFVTVNENDEKILKKLVNIKVEGKEDKLSYSIIFEFLPNEYFSNEKLTKTFIYDIKDHQCHKVESDKVAWKSPDLIPNKVNKTKTVKSIFYFYFRG